MKKEYEIKGIHCISCVEIIKTKLGKMNGINKLSIDMINKKAIIDFDENIIDLNIINQEINKYGYSFHKISSNENNNKIHQTKNSEFKKNVLISVPLIIIAIISMIYMISIENNWIEKNLFIHHLLMGLMPIFATIMLFYIGNKYIIAVYRYIKNGTANMETLIGIGTLTAFVYSFIAKTFFDIRPEILSKQVYFEAVIIVIGVVEIGKYLESIIMQKTGDSIKKLAKLQVKKALIIKDGKQILTPIENILTNDIIIVKPGEIIPLDGEIIKGNANIDESMITGEPIPVFKSINEKVIGGTICTDSSIEIKVLAIGKKTYLNKIISIVENAQNSKTKIQKLTDKIMKYFIPTSLIIAISGLVFWLFFGNYFFPGINNIQFAILSFVGVLIISCPCGLGLATPMAIITGIGHGAKNGILIKNAEGLLKLQKSKIMVFDKTGTLTEGKPQLIEYKTEQIDNTHFEILVSLESLSSHPIAKAITNYGKINNIKTFEIKDFKNIQGVGLQGSINETKYIVANIKYLIENEINYDKKIINKRTNEGKTPLILLSEKKIIGYYAIADEIKKSTQNSINLLQKKGIRTIMLTGDHNNTSNYIAKKIGINEIFSEKKPDEKVKIINELKKQGIVTMIGDGINDAPALANADIGISMSDGNDIAIESCEIVLLKGDLNKILKAIKISILTKNAITQNLIWAFGFNIIGIPLAVGLFYPILGTLINPTFEGAAMALSSLTVLLNSYRLQNKNIN